MRERQAVMERGRNILPFYVRKEVVGMAFVRTPVKRNKKDVPLRAVSQSRLVTNCKVN